MPTFNIQTNDFVEAMALLGKQFQEDPDAKGLGKVQLKTHGGMKVSVEFPPVGWKPKKGKKVPSPPAASTKSVWDRLGEDEAPAAPPRIDPEEIESVTKAEPKPPRRRPAPRAEPAEEFDPAEFIYDDSFTPVV